MVFIIIVIALFFILMGRGINNTKITKDYILSKVSQIRIFSVYFNISIEKIQHCIDTGDCINSPIRDDTHPSCGFQYDNKGKLKMRDWAGYFWGDCFDAVATILTYIEGKQINISNKKDFIKVLTHITFTFKNIFYGNDEDELLNGDIVKAINIAKKQKPNIEIVVRDWDTYDINYWSRMNVDIQTLNINFIYPVEQYYIDRKINPYPKYFYTPKDPCYGYLLGKDKSGINHIKLYFPNRRKTETKFITNCNHLEGIYNLVKNDYDYIVITKSTKDRVTISSNLKSMQSLYGELNIGVINIPHETYKLREYEYTWLLSKLKDNGHILSLMDNDITGKMEAIWLRDTYNIIPLIIPKYTNCKDFSELIINCKHLITDIISETIQKINKYVKEIDNKKNIQCSWNKEFDDSSPF